ncbi:MAG TPA: histidine kinase [Streptosporangiaceae bacterium]|jgi:two-component system sensor histidine kinase DesK
MDTTPEKAARFAFWAAMIVMLGYFMIPAAAVVADQTGFVHVLFAIGSLTLLGLLQIGHTVYGLTRRADGGWRLPLFFVPSWTLPVQVLFTYAPIWWFGEPWLGIPAFLACTVLLILPMPRSLLAFAAIVIVEVPLARAAGFTMSRSLYAALSVMLTGVALFGLIRLATMVHELYRARAELARLAVAEERLRFARDLHDLLGHRLSVVALKSELASRFLPADPDKAREQMSDITEIVHKALSDVRRVAHDYRGMSFEEELGALTSVLESAGITCRVNAAARGVSPGAMAALTWALREGTTNVLRHSKASVCTIQTELRGDLVYLEIVNDGAPSRHAEDGADRPGGGIPGLIERVTMVGGRAVAERCTDDLFRLMVEVPRDGTVS